jgi:phosphonate transport system ATP-binding protein
MSLVQALAATQGFLAIVNLHNVELARRFADRIIGMAGGEVVFDGRPDELHDNCLRSIYGGEDWLA